MGRKAHRPDPTSRRQVEAMAGYGVPELAIARVIAVDPKTLRKHYREELDTGQIEAIAKVAERLFRKATGDCGHLLAEDPWRMARDAAGSSNRRHRPDQTLRRRTRAHDRDAAGRHRRWDTQFGLRSLIGSRFRWGWPTFSRSAHK